LLPQRSAFIMGHRADPPKGVMGALSEEWGEDTRCARFDA
jgi:hypothetical protein